MKRILYILLLAVALLSACEKTPSGGYTPGQNLTPGGSGTGGTVITPAVADYSRLTARNHPRIFMDDAEFAAMKAKVESGENPVLVKLHEVTMQIANTYGLSAGTIVKEYDKSDKRILNISKEALLRIFSAAYAYRYTGEEKYLEHAENDMLAVCNFDDWNAANHFLDTGEMTAAVALGYDWLYKELPESSRSLIQEKIAEYAFDSAENRVWNLNFYENTGNWNQVCNGGLVLGALAVYETMPERAKKLIEKSVESNKISLEANYSPDGNYIEGPGYWRYGTLYQVVMLTALETTVGTDFNLSRTQGFDKTGQYMLFTIGATGKVFNYSDNQEVMSPYYPLWYFADKFGKPELLVFEKRLLEEDAYPTNSEARFMPLMMAYASRIDLSSMTVPEEQVYIGKGETPVFMVHTDWTNDENDEYLGVKGGYASANHGHMDAGSFVFDAEGVRWSMDMSHESYANIEVAMKGLGGNLWDMGQNSMRWDVTRINNHFHSTLTLNDAYHKVDGAASVVKVIDTERQKGVSLNLSPVFSGEASSVTRTVTLQKNSDLQVQDEIRASSNKDTKVRWTMISTAKPTVVGNYIQLVADGKARYLFVACDAVPVTLKTWSTDPTSFGKPVNRHEKVQDGVYALGFEATVPKGEAAAFKVTLSKTR